MIYHSYQSYHSYRSYHSFLSYHSYHSDHSYYSDYVTLVNFPTPALAPNITKLNFPVTLSYIKKNSYLCNRNPKSPQGAVLEWLKRHAWKACIPQKGIPSSNLGRSAK